MQSLFNIWFSGWGPYAYFKAMEEGRANSSNTNQNEHIGQGLEGRVVNQEARSNSGFTFTTIP